MDAKWLRRLGMGALVGVAVASGACAQERDPINHVQPQAIAKSFFIGADYESTADDPEFYARTMIVDVAFGAPSYMFANGFNNSTRIKWDIQENLLIGRTSYERITGTDGKGNGPASKDGQIAYAFRIISQFDIRRAYNPATGEELNVVEENSSDRPWMKRDYFRVDFSKNLNTSAYELDSLALTGMIQGGIDYESVGYNFTNPDDPNAPQYDFKNGYFDVTDVVLAKPQMVTLPERLGGGTYPACQLAPLINGGTAPIGACDSTDITLRHSFRRVVDTDYQPWDYDGWRFQNFGAFNFSRRYGFDRQYGLVDKEHYRFMQRYNLWERSHYYADPVKMTGAIACKVDDDCAPVAKLVGEEGSTCDTIKSKCTLPYRKRTVRPIVWHYQDGGDPVYFDPSRDATTDWDTAMRIAVDATRRAECNRYGNTDGSPCNDAVTGEIADEDDALKLVREVQACRRGEIPGQTDCNAFADAIGAQRAYSPAVIATAKEKPVVILCHSPVVKEDDALCGDVGTRARGGDLRYNLVSNIYSPNSTGFWGIMTDADDPTSGEKIAASINVFTQPTESISRSIIDVLRYINGEIAASDITEGKYVDDFITAAKAMQGMKSPGNAATQFDQHELDSRMAAPFGLDAKDLHSKSAPAEVRDAILRVGEHLTQVQASTDAASVNTTKYLARLKKATGTPFEAELLTQPMLQAGGGSLSALDDHRSASILSGLNPTVIRELEHAREIGFAEAGICVIDDSAADTAPLSDPALGDTLQAKFGKFDPTDPLDAQLARAEKMRDFVRRRMHVGVIIHEMGHSFALRHNFVSSSDAYNFRPQYWQLRTNDGKTTTACTTPTADGKTCVGPRRFDPVTTNEMSNLIGMWAQSSVMEYPGDSTQDFLTLGAYDFAAVRMFYGDVGSVYTEPTLASNTANGKLAIDHMANFGGILGITYHSAGNFGSPLHYSQLQKQVGMIRDCKQVNTADFKPANWNEQKDGVWSPMLDGFIVTNEAGQTTRCKVQPVDFVQFGAMSPQPDVRSAFNNHPFQADAGKRTRVPYGFATDDWADLGNLSVYRHDNGADAYELMNFWIAQQEVNHIFANYRRGRAVLDIRKVYNRTLSRYHEKMRDAAKGLGLYVNIARDTASQFSPQDGDKLASDVVSQVGADLLIASSMAFDHFAHVFARPEPGDHAELPGVEDSVQYSTDDLGFANAPKPTITIPNGVFGKWGVISLGGRPIENALSTHKGEFNRDYTDNVGSYYEKAYTAMLFTESIDNFISSSPNDFSDPRFRSVSMADVFPDGFRRWLGNNLTGDNFLKGPRVAADAGGSPIVDGKRVPKSGIGWTSWWPATGVTSCFPGQNITICQDPNNPLTNLNPEFPAKTTVISPEVNWEQQKFAIAMTLAYLPENQKQNWMRQLYIWELGENTDPGFANRIEFHDPQGPIYIARTEGTEVIFGKTVQRSIGARVLEWANTLMQKAYLTTPVTQNGTTWYVPVLDSNGKPQVLNPADPSQTISSCAGNQFCVQLANYATVPKFMRQAMSAYGLDVEFKGVY